VWARPGYKEKMKKILFRGGKTKGACVDCGTAITLRNKRCTKCSGLNKKGKNFLTEEGLLKISDRKGIKNPNWRGGKWKVKNAFENKIRRLQKYKNWRGAILKRDVLSYPKVPKNVQVHHLISLRSMIEKNNIETIEQAKECTGLWNIDNGVALWKSEHYVITLLHRRKNISRGFIEWLKAWVAINRHRAKEIK